MELNQSVSHHFRISRNFPVALISLITTLYGIYLISDVLINEITSHHVARLSDLLIELPLLIGISVIYLSTLLRRRKRTAWFVTVLAFTFLFGINVSQILNHQYRHLALVTFIRIIILPALIVWLLIYFRAQFFVRSDIAGFRFAIVFVVSMLLLAIVYGVSGFELLDKSDFHQEISWQSALHYTIDQFNLTTSKPIHPYTKRARLFVDSLSFVSAVAVIYALLSLFAPLRFRFSDQTLAREGVKDLLSKYQADSEEFFKIWPHDKQYFFDKTKEAAIAYRVYHGVALVLSDPIGDASCFESLLDDFKAQCTYNDWLPALIHVSSKYLPVYEKLGFAMQKLGQEAIVKTDAFISNVRPSKYYRNIENKFKKQDYSFEVLVPPHHEAVIDRLKIISDEWLKSGGRAERGFAMGYFTPAYMQMCKIAIARDAAGTIQAFANIIPADFDTKQGSYDMIRNSKRCLGNVVDYLMINIIAYLQNSGYSEINLGLCPLAGIADSKEQNIVNNVLKFAYNNGDMFFSFSGLYKFKAKYDPIWQDTYVCYQGGLTGFSRTMTALTRCMTKVVRR